MADVKKCKASFHNLPCTFPIHPSRKGGGKDAGGGGEHEHRYHSSSGLGAAGARMSLTVRDGTDVGLTGVGIYFIRTSTKRTLGYVNTQLPLTHAGRYHVHSLHH